MAGETVGRRIEDEVFIVDDANGGGGSEAGLDAFETYGVSRKSDARPGW